MKYGRLLLVCIIVGFTIFAKADTYQNKAYKNWKEHLLSGKSSPLRNDRVENLFPGLKIIKNLAEIEKLNLLNAQLSTKPWSDDYWPIYKGILGARYNDGEYHYLDDWQDSRNYVLEYSAVNIFKSGNSTDINSLSPSEKFDLLLDIEKGPLTEQMWKQGEYYHNNSPDGSIESWMGICHGWAPASYMVPRPKNSISVMAADNKTKIKFYPSDLKALASLLWASGKYKTNFIGGRCNRERPDPAGREYQDCLDTNPASFHLSLVNGIGLHDKSFVMDVTYDYEVWNQPVLSYKYKYFNPITEDQFDSLKDAVVSLENFKEDPYGKYRANGATKLVGISLEVEYIVETSPTSSDHDSVLMDSKNTGFYLYDLELNDNLSIVGGEWYSNDHPDFLWSPDYNSRALAPEDYYLLSRKNWDGKQAIALEIKRLGKRAGKRGIPLAYLVNSLIELSNKMEL